MHGKCEEPAQPELLLQQSPDMIGTASREGYFTWLNAHWQKTLGWTPDELCARPYIDFVHPEDVQSTIEAASLLNQGREATLFVNRYQCKDGSWRWLEWNARFGLHNAVYFVARDITVRAHEQTERQRTLELLRLGEEVGRTGHWRVDLVRETVFWSPEVFRIHGRSPDTYTPTLQDGINAYHPEDRQRVSDYVQNAIDRRATFEFELRILRPDGEVRHVQSIGKPEIDEQTDQVVGIFGVFRDITDDDRARRTRELEQFAYMTSHDLHEPVRTIRAFVGLINESQVEFDEQTAQFWNHIDQAAVRLQNLITDLLHYTRAGQPLTLTSVDLKEVLHDVCANLAAQIEDNGASIAVASSLPHVAGDHVRLTQLFQNLVSNAIKFCGDAPADIRVGAERRGDQWVVRVEDRGVGFDAEHAERIFAPFKRLHSRSEYDGTGIGLAVVQRIAEQCRGRVWAHGQRGEGATFFVALDPYQERLSMRP